MNGNKRRICANRREKTVTNRNYQKWPRFCRKEADLFEGLINACQKVVIAKSPAFHTARGWSCALSLSLCKAPAKSSRSHDLGHGSATCHGVASQTTRFATQMMDLGNCWHAILDVIQHDVSVFPGHLQVFPAKSWIAQKTLEVNVAACDSSRFWAICCHVSGLYFDLKGNLHVDWLSEITMHQACQRVWTFTDRDLRSDKGTKLDTRNKSKGSLMILLNIVVD